MKKHILFIASLAAMVACSRNDGLSDSNSDNVKLIVKDYVYAENGRPVDSDPATRSTLSIDNSGVNFSFTNGDMLGVFPNETYTQQLRIKTNIEEGEAPEFSGATVGWLLGEDIDYAAYYPFQADYHLNPGAVTFNYTGQTQNDNGNAADNQAHLGSYDFLYSNVQTPDGNQVTFTLSHAGAILHVRHLDSYGGEYSALIISATDESAVFPENVSVDLFSQSISPASMASSFSIALENFESAAGSNLNVWCMLPPVDLSGKTLQFTFTGKNETPDCSFTMPGKNLEAGNLYDFIEHVYALRYNAGEGEFESDIHQYTDIKVAKGASCDFTVTDREPVLAGHRLTGWSETDGGSVAYTAGETYTVENTKWEIEDKLANLYAVYEEVHDQVTVTWAADPAEGGTVTIDGEPVSFKNVAPGTQVSLQAIPNLGYKFSKWSDGWPDASRIETINGNVTYTAEFTKLVVVNVESSEQSKGSVSGDGYYSPGADVTITASPESGYEFEKWVVSATGEEITVNPYSFTAAADISFTAYFKEAAAQADGSLPGVFSVSATKKVKFSQGNLQYQASTNTWRFAEHQYDHIGDGGTKAGNVAGSDNTQISSTYSGWIDLFGWATSGDNTNRISTDAYQPWTTNSTASNYYNKDKNGSTTEVSLSVADKTDWGCNTIKYFDGTGWSSTNKPINGWRTPISADLGYIIGTSSPNRGGLMYIGCYLVINSKNVYGFLLLPDNWTQSDWPGDNKPATSKYNTSGLPSIEITIQEFGELQKKGVVFLPQTGYRAGANFNYNAVNTTSGKLLYYWASDRTKYNNAYCLKYTNSFDISTNTSKNYGYAVRLVTDVPSE